MTFWKKKKRPEVVGLDIGTSAVKVVELKPKGSGYELGGFGIAHVPAGAIQGGEVKHPDAVQQAIRQALVQGGVQATEAVIGVSGGSVIAKRVNLPKMSENELGESIRWEAEQHIPFDIDDVNIDFQILRQDGPQLEVMLVAVKKGKVQFKERNYGKAYAYFKKAVEVYPDDPQAWLGYSAAADRLGRFDNADIGYAKLAKMIPTRTEYLNNRGYSYLLRGDLQRARQYFLKAYEIDPANVFTANNLELLRNSANFVERAPEAKHAGSNSTRN